MFNQTANIDEQMRLMQSIDTDTQSKILRIDYGKEDLNKLRLKAPFLEFLENAGVVFDTDEPRHQYEAHVLKNRAGLNGEYGGTEKLEIDRDGVVSDYGTAVIDSPTVKSSDLFSFTATGQRVNARTQDNIVRDLQTGIDEAIFKATGAYAQNKFDGLIDKASNVIDLKGEVATVNVINDASQVISDNHGQTNVIVGTGRAIKQVIDSDDAKKVFAPKEALTVGSWGNLFQSEAGITPMLTDGNINNRVPGTTTDDIIVVMDYTSYEVRFLVRQYMKALAATDLADSYKYATFVSSCLKVPEWCTVIKGIGRDAGTGFIKVKVLDAGTDEIIKGATVKVTADSVEQEGVTNNSGFTNVAFKNGNDLTLDVSATGYIAYNGTVAKADIATQEVQLVKQ